MSMSDLNLGYFLFYGDIMYVSQPCFDLHVSFYLLSFSFIYLIFLFFLALILLFLSQLKFLGPKFVEPVLVVLMVL